VWSEVMPYGIVASLAEL